MEILTFNMGKLVAICISEKRGIQKHQVEKATLNDHGIIGDAHAGNWHRQISILDKEVIDEFNEKGADVSYGMFAENLVIEGINVNKLPIGTYLKIGKSLLEITQRGKECHNNCEIFKKMGDCIMPRLGVFTKVIKDGEIKVMDEVEIIKREHMPFTAAVITLSDKGYKGEREDISGPTISKRLKENKYDVVEEILLPDNKEMLKRTLIRLCDQREVSLILTTGGTGFSNRDITPEATSEVIERFAPGISEAIRYESMKHTKHAMLSRGISGIRNKTLIINLPGSPKACIESMDVFLDAIEHGLKLIRGEDGECGRK